ncbi:MAG: protein-disulfide reductase DsbD [Planctomycetes bacterium]|nr:protein-disulfide reductase DsbD [Planctomycetota bacterium]
MKASFFTKGLFAIVFIMLLFPLKTFGETPPFKVNVTLLKDHIPAGDIIPVAITLAIAPNHHIYKDQVKVESGDTAQFTVASTELPAGKIKYDQFLEKEVENYEGQVEIKSYLQASKDIPAGSYNIKLKVHYQGCSDKICFAPKMEEFTLPVQVEPASWGVAGSQKEEKPAPPASKPVKKVEAGGFQKTIESRGIFVSLILIFLAGVGLSFTPCVYPMIPITIAVIGGQATGDQSAGRKSLTAFFLSLIYVLGIAIVYSAMGVAAASTGALFGTALQSPWVIGFVVAVFIGLALSMFGVYYLRVPSFISDRMGTGARKGILGVFVMGLVSGIVASPCIGPALASLLVYIASTGNKFMGFWMLFVFAWGLGVLLIVLGIFSGAIKSLPKSGVWMETVERIFGLLLIGAALYYLRLIISESAFVVIMGLFLIVTAVFSGGFDRLTHESTNFQRARRAFGLIAFIFGAYFLVGHLMIKGLILPPFSATTPAQSVTTQEKINWVVSEEEGLKQAKMEGKPAIIDFWASWCAACMEFEKITYPDPEVIKELKKFVNIKIDCTNTNDPTIKQLWEKYGIVGLPTIVFINKDGTVVRDKTITGFVNPQEFLSILRSL